MPTSSTSLPPLQTVSTAAIASAAAATSVAALCSSPHCRSYYCLPPTFTCSPTSFEQSFAPGAHTPCLILPPLRACLPSLHSRHSPVSSSHSPARFLWGWLLLGLPACRLLCLHLCIHLFFGCPCDLVCSGQTLFSPQLPTVPRLMVFPVVTSPPPVIVSRDSARKMSRNSAGAETAHPSAYARKKRRRSGLMSARVTHLCR